MAGLQSCFRNIVVTANLRVIQKNGALRQATRARHSLAFQMLSRDINKSKLLVNSFYKCNVRLASTNIPNQESIIDSVEENVTTQTSTLSQSVSNSSNEPVSQNTFVIDEASLPPIPTVDSSQTDTVLEFVSTGLKEPSFESLGLGSYWPSGLLQRLLEFLHIQFDLPWWAVIVTVTITFRILLLPFSIKAKRNAVNLNNHMPEMQRLQMKLTEARHTGNYYDAALQLQEIVDYTTKHNISPIKSFLPQLAQSPIFLSMYFGLKGMSEAPVESMKTGGLFWFTDLTVPDPYYILPCVITGSLYLALELGAEGGSLSTMSHKTWVPYVVRGCCFIVLPIIISVPQSILWYWTVSNFFTLMQIPLFKSKVVKKYFGIPDFIRHPQSEEAKKKKSFTSGIKDSITNYKLTKELQERDYLNSVTFDRAGKAPVQRTFKKNPKLKEMDASK